MHTTTTMLYLQDTLYSDQHTIKSARNTGGELCTATYTDGVKNVEHAVMDTVVENRTVGIL